MLRERATLPLVQLARRRHAQHDCLTACVHARGLCTREQLRSALDDLAATHERRARHLHGRVGCSQGAQGHRGGGCCCCCSGGRLLGVPRGCGDRRQCCNHRLERVRVRLHGGECDSLLRREEQAVLREARHLPVLVRRDVCVHLAKRNEGAHADEAVERAVEVAVGGRELLAHHCGAGDGGCPAGCLRRCRARHERGGRVRQLQQRVHLARLRRHGGGQPRQAAARHAAQHVHQQRALGRLPRLGVADRVPRGR